PKTPECYIAILSVIKIGAIAGPLFEAFMEDAVRDRINDCHGSLLITDKEMVRRVPEADIPSLETILFAEDIEAAPFRNSGEDLVEWMDGDDGMLIHYTSGSTGKPKGVLHAHRVGAHPYQSGQRVTETKDDEGSWWREISKRQHAEIRARILWNGWTAMTACSSIIPAVRPGNLRVCCMHTESFPISISPANGFWISKMMMSTGAHPIPAG